MVLGDAVDCELMLILAIILFLSLPIIPEHSKVCVSMRWIAGEVDLGQPLLGRVRLGTRADEVTKKKESTMTETSEMEKLG